MWPHELEAQWTPEDVAEVLSWRAYEHGRCPRCGVHPDEWKGRDEDDVYFPDPVRCPGCAMLDEQNRELPSDPPGARDGITVRLVPFDEDRFIESQMRAEQAREHRLSIDPTPAGEPTELGPLES